MNIDDCIEYLQDKIDDLRDDRQDADLDEDYDYADFLSDEIGKLMVELDSLILERDM